MSEFLFTCTKRFPVFTEQARGRKLNRADAEFTACPIWQQTIRRLPGSTIQRWPSAAAVRRAHAWNAQTIWSPSNFTIKREFTNAKGTTYSFTGTKIRLSDVDGGPRPAGWTSALLLLNGGHGFHGGVVQVLRCCDGQAALRQDPLGLVHVGSWQRREENGYGGGASRRGQTRGSADGGGWAGLRVRGGKFLRQR